MKIIIAGGVYVLKSDAKLEDLKYVQKYSPDTLVLKDEDGDPTFAISVGCTSSISKYGVCFNTETHDEDKLACITMPLPSGITNAQEYVVDQIGDILANLTEIEGLIAGAIEGVKAKRAAVAESIEVVA